MEIGVVGVNYKLANLDLRETLAKACLKHFGPESWYHTSYSPVLLSTCNRTEIYFGSSNLSGAHSYILNVLKNEINSEIEQKLYSFFHCDCFHHLARVVSGLDSALTGETEIQGQVKNAYEKSQKSLLLSPAIHFLFQKGLKIGKEIRSSFKFDQNVTGIKHSIYHIGEHLFQNPHKLKLLFIGASTINSQIWPHLQSRGISDITLCNRTAQNGENAQKRWGLQTLPWKDLEEWRNFDWVICGTKSPTLLLNKIPTIKSVYKQKQLLIDLSVPRNIDPLLGKDPDRTLVNIDQINRSLKHKRKSRKSVFDSIERTVEASAHRQHEIFLQKKVAAHKKQPRSPVRQLL